jgi:AcrR family transcriptional regulator
MLTLPTLTSMTVDVDTVNMSRPYHHGNLRATLVDAAMELARTGGPAAVALRAASRQAGVSHNAAYRHFADHDELLGAVAARCMGELARLMQERTAAVRVRDPRQRALARLEAIGRAYIEFAVTEPGWFRTAFSGVGHGPADADDQQGDDQQGDDQQGDPFLLLSARLDELVEVGVLPPERRPGAEHAAWSMVHGLSGLLLDGPLRGASDAEREALTRGALTVVQRGL